MKKNEGCVQNFCLLSECTKFEVEKIQIEKLLLIKLFHSFRRMGQWFFLVNWIKKVWKSWWLMSKFGFLRPTPWTPMVENDLFISWAYVLIDIVQDLAGIYEGDSALISTEWWMIFYLFIYFKVGTPPRIMFSSMEGEERKELNHLLTVIFNRLNWTWWIDWFVCGV